MALNIKLFAPVARATNAIYMYVPDATGTTLDGKPTPSAGDAWATVKGANYFNNAQLVGSVKVGDMVLVNAQGTFGVLLITAVNVKEKTITTRVATLGA